MPRNSGRWMMLFGAAALCVGLCGCNSTFRRLTIRSDPPGALVILDGKEVGYTPYSTDFIYYGTRELTLVKDGFRTMTRQIRVAAPWYQIPPLDFFSDNLLPVKITNRQEFAFALEPVNPNDPALSVESLLNRANGLRSESQVGGP